MRKLFGVSVLGVNQVHCHKNIHDIIKVEREMGDTCFPISYNNISKREYFTHQPHPEK